MHVCTNPKGQPSFIQMNEIMKHLPRTTNGGSFFPVENRLGCAVDCDCMVVLELFGRDPVLWLRFLLSSPIM